MLLGVVKKNGILQVDYTNTLRAPRHGARRGDPARRTGCGSGPILMTTMMLVLGMIPIALGRGPGAGSRSSIAKVIVGGQMLSLLITLLITPVAYSLFDDLGAVRCAAAAARRRSRALLPRPLRSAGRP